MNSPVVSYDLHGKQSGSVPVTCMDFKSGCELNNFVVGTEDSFIYSVSRHGK
jgi:hypothetical protein